MTLEERCRPISLLLSDVDGVLTDGMVLLDNQGVEAKSFHIRDGLGIKLWQKAGYQFGMITLRSTQSMKSGQPSWASRSSARECPIRSQP